MKQLDFTATYGDEKKNVKITEPNGTGGGFQVFIDDYYQGMLMKLNNEWVGHLNDKSQLSPDDISALGDIIDKENLK